MVKKWMTAIALAVLVSWQVVSWAAGGDAKTVIAGTMKAMGDLKTVEFTGSGADFSLGQPFNNTTSGWPRFNLRNYTRAIDFEAPASRMSAIRTQGENPPRGGGGQPLIGEQNQNQVVAPGAQGPQAANLQGDLMMMPWGFLKMANANNASASQKTVAGKKYTVVSFQGPNKAQVNGYINDQQMVERVETWVDNAVLGNMLSEALYSDYKDFGGVKFPTKMVRKQGGWPTFEMNVTDVKPNLALRIEPPQAKGKGGGGGPGGPGGPVPEPEKLSDGVYLILGGYASIAVDMKDGVTVIEAGQSEQRSLQVMDQVKKLFPGKAITRVVNTHVHFDHSSGLRTYVAEGATIVTHASNKDYYQKAFSNPNTIAPGKLEETKRKPKFDLVTEKKVLTDGNHVIEIHHVKGSIHNEGMLLVYLPKEKVIVEADEFNPPPPNQPVANVSPYWTNLNENLDRLKLDYDRIIPIHYPNDNRKVMKAELLRAVGKG